MIPEWVKLYINYQLLKSYLGFSKHVRQHKKNCKIYEQIMGDPLIAAKLRNDAMRFIQTFQEEVRKMECFLIFKLQDIKKKRHRLTIQVKIMRIVHNKYKRKILKESLYNFYIELQQYKQYLELNQTAVIKILKKYKKLMIFRNKCEENQQLGQYFDDLTILKQLPTKITDYSNEIEKMLTNNYYKLNPRHCRDHIRKYTQTKPIKNRTFYKFGLFVGFALVLVVLILYLRYDGYVDPDEKTVFSKLFPCFRGMALFLIYYWFIALDMWGWTYFHINYKIYLGFNHHFSTVPEVLRRCSYLSSVFLVIFVVYILKVENIGSFQDNEITTYLPLIVWAVGIFYVFVPTKRVLNGAGRRWMYRMIYGATIGHFFKYESRYTFFLDQFVSMVTPLRDVDYTICYYYIYLTTQEEHVGQCYYQQRISGALLAIIPYSLKCIHYITRARDKGKFWHTDEMWNFFKTLLAVSVGVLGYLSRQQAIFKYVWIPVACITSLIQYWWDLKKDWLFFEPDSKVPFLRNDLGYNNPYIYYSLALLNLVLRLTWVLSISPDTYIHFGAKDRELFIFCVGFLEMCRRLINNFMKIEKEYITNLRSLKTVQDIQFPFDEGIVVAEPVFEQASLSTLRRTDTRDSQDIDNIRLSAMRDTLENQLDDISSRAIRNYKLPNEMDILVHKNLDMDIIEKAKKSEKFQASQIRLVKTENTQFKQQIKLMEKGE